MSREAFLDSYQTESGREVNRRTLHFYEVMACFKCTAICLGAAVQTAASQQNHQDAHQAWLPAAGHAFAEELI